MIHPMTENTANIKARDAIKIKSVRNEQKKDSSESLSSDFDSPGDSDYKSSILNNKKSHKKRTLSNSAQS